MTAVTVADTQQFSEQGYLIIRQAFVGAELERLRGLAGAGIDVQFADDPTLLAGAELYAKLTHHADDFGLSFDNLQVDWSKVEITASASGPVA